MEWLRAQTGCYGDHFAGAGGCSMVKIAKGCKMCLARRLSKSMARGHGGRSCTLIFPRLCTPTSSSLSEILRNIGNSRAMEEVIFFLACAPWRPLRSIGSLLHLSDLLLLGMLRTSGHLLQVRKSDLYEVTSVMLSMLGRTIFLKSLPRPFACCFETHSSSTCDAML